jgi:hypothetical protein
MHCIAWHIQICENRADIVILEKHCCTYTSSIITLVTTITRIINAIARHSSPAVRTGAMHTVFLRDGMEPQRRPIGVG